MITFGIYKGLEKKEEEYDLQLAENTYKAHIESNQKTYSFESVLKELGWIIE